MVHVEAPTSSTDRNGFCEIPTAGATGDLNSRFRKRATTKSLAPFKDLLQHFFFPTIGVPHQNALAPFSARELLQPNEPETQKGNFHCFATCRTRAIQSASRSSTKSALRSAHRALASRSIRHSSHRGTVTRSLMSETMLFLASSASTAAAATRNSRSSGSPSDALQSHSKVQFSRRYPMVNIKLASSTRRRSPSSGTILERIFDTSSLLCPSKVGVPDHLFSIRASSRSA